MTEHTARSQGLRVALWLMGLALALRLVMAWSNYGFVAMDDYSDILDDAVPAQQVGGADSVIAASGIRSPLPRLLIYGMGQASLSMGIQDPVGQVRWIYALLGLASMVSVWLVWWMFRVLGRSDWATHAIVWTGLHFLAVFLSTRALIENMAAPFVTAAAVFLVVYDQRRRTGWLAAALVALAIASIFRFQAGIVVVALVAVPLVRRRWRDIGVFLAVGAVLFVVTGLVDSVLRGEFHQSLRDYLDYNVQYSSIYGVSAWYNYVLLLAVATLPPLLLSRYRGFSWRRYWEPLWPALLVVTVFVVAHSAVPHKEDRFMVPIMPLWLALLAPLSAFLFAQRPRSWRTLGFVAVNATVVILLLAVPTQYNVIGLIRYLRVHPEIREVSALGTSVEAHPIAYSERPIPPIVRIDDTPESGTCSSAFVIRQDLIPPGLTGWREVVVFRPGLPERLVIWINPEHNTRRNPIHLFVPAGCGNGSRE